MGCCLSLLTGCAGGTSQKDVITVDIFDVISRRWSTSALSVARGFLAAASLPNQGLAIFAGGLIGSLFSDVPCYNALCLP
jgi:hypothetical protein